MSTTAEAAANLNEDIEWKSRTGFARQRVDQIEDIRTVLGALEGATHDDVLKVHAKGREEGAREEAMEWAERTRFEVIAETIHAAWEHQYDECDHGTYTGGIDHGKPYKMCEIFARAVHRRITA